MAQPKSESDNDWIVRADNGQERTCESRSEAERVAADMEVLGHFYDISVQSEVVVPPEETDFEFCRAKATATTPDGVAYEAHGSAHVDRGDDSTLLLELADTRSCKRAMSAATGVGAVAVEELKNDIEGGV